MFTHEITQSKSHTRCPNILSHTRCASRFVIVIVQPTPPSPDSDTRTSAAVRRRRMMIYIRLMCADPVVFVLIPECNAIGGYMFNAMIPSPSSKWNNIIPIRWQCGIGWFLSVCVCDCGEHCSVKCRSRSLSPHCEAATSNNRSPNQCLRTFGRQTAAASGYVCEICGVAKHFNT